MTEGAALRVFSEYDAGRVLASVQELIDHGLLVSKGRPVIVRVAPAENRRTGAQNRYMWPLLRAIGTAAGEPDDEKVKEEMLTRWAGERHETHMGRRRQVYPKTSAFTVAQMVNFIEFCRAEAANTYGITPPMERGYEDYAAGARA